MKWKTMNELEAETDAFYGTEQYHFNPLYPGLKYTDGVQFLGANGFGWLLDWIGIEAHPLLLKGGHGLYLILMDVQDNRATLTVCVDMDGENLIEVVLKKHVSYTDAPKGRMKLYWENGVLLLPSEY